MAHTTRPEAASDEPRHGDAIVLGGGMAGLAHVYPHDRGVSMAIALGRRVAADTDVFLESG